MIGSWPSSYGGQLALPDGVPIESPPKIQELWWITIVLKSKVFNVLEIFIWGPIPGQALF